MDHKLARSDNENGPDADTSGSSSPEYLPTNMGTLRVILDEENDPIGAPLMDHKLARSDNENGPDADTSGSSSPECLPTNMGTQRVILDEENDPSETYHGPDMLWDYVELDTATVFRTMYYGPYMSDVELDTSVDVNISFISFGPRMSDVEPDTANDTWDPMDPFPIYDVPDPYIDESDYDDILYAG